MTQAVDIAQSGSNNVTMRNRIINGAMMIDQRTAGASITPTVSQTYSVDRWVSLLSASSKYSLQQNSGTAPTTLGFSQCLKMTSLSAYSVGSGDYFSVQQVIEGLNIQDLAWGTASAKTVTLSFLVYSSLTGTFSGSLRNYDSNRAYPFTYTISSANTWTQISITIAGDTTGTWYTTNSGGIQVGFCLGVGSTYGSGTANSWQSGNIVGVSSATSVVGTSGATFYITGVQLEAGTTASPFEQRLYGTELALCQRYFENSNPEGVVAYIPFSAYTTADMYGAFFYKVTKRTTPTASFNATAWNVYAASAAKTFTSIGIDGIGVSNVALYILGSGWSGGQAAFARNLGVNAIQISAEL
jgi:hypothetical protein